MQIQDYQAVRAAGMAVELDAIPEPAPYARKHVEQLQEKGYASLVLRQLVREAQSSRRTRDLDSLEKNAERLDMSALENGLAAFVDALETGREAYGRREPIRHFGQAKNPVNSLPIVRQAVITWETVCAMAGRLVLSDRPLSVQTLAKLLGKRLKEACGNADEYRTLGYERAALVLLDLFCSSTGWLEEVTGAYNVLRRTNETNKYRFTDKFVTDVCGGSLAEDFYEGRPMLVPPVPWTEAGRYGGYLHSGVQAVRQAGIAIHSPEIVGALNALQATPFRVNQRILEVARAFRHNAEDAHVTGVQGYYVEERHDVAPDVARSKTIRSALTLAAVEELKDEDAFYFPWNLDWRGRMYPATTIISPQGSDLCKGLLEFSEGTPLGRDGARWLHIHLCNLYGADKMTVDGKKVARTPDERVKWAYEHGEEFLAYVLAPLNNRGWMKADKPWQFLAACFEYMGYQVEGEQFRSRIAGALDGSCSGVQMLAGMTRDESAGAMVNLTPLERGDDYYGRMAEALKRRLYMIATDSPDEATLGRLKYWAEQDISRDLLKAPSMTKVYSAGTFTFGEQIIAKTDAEPSAALWLAAHINGCFGDVAPGMLRAMEYVQGVADVLTDARHSLVWVTPSGLPVNQARMCTETHRLDMRNGARGNVHKFERETDKLNPRAQRAGVSPNFVHGVDASHMVYVINDLHARGVRNFWMIHDSFGAPFAQCGEVYESTREQFARLMSRDLLARWTEQVTAVLTPEQKEKLPRLPEYGTLDLEQVKESIYAWF